MTASLPRHQGPLPPNRDERIFDAVGFGCVKARYPSGITWVPRFSRAYAIGWPAALLVAWPGKKPPWLASRCFFPTRINSWTPCGLRNMHLSDVLFLFFWRARETPPGKHQCKRVGTATGFPCLSRSLWSLERCLPVNKRPSSPPGLCDASSRRPET